MLLQWQIVTAGAIWSSVWLVCTQSISIITWCFRLISLLDRWPWICLGLEKAHPEKANLSTDHGRWGTIAQKLKEALAFKNRCFCGLEIELKCQESWLPGRPAWYSPNFFFKYKFSRRLPSLTNPPALGNPAKSFPYLLPNSLNKYFSTCQVSGAWPSSSPAANLPWPSKMSCPGMPSSFRGSQQSSWGCGWHTDFSYAFSFLKQKVPMDGEKSRPWNGQYQSACSLLRCLGYSCRLSQVQLSWIGLDWYKSRIWAGSPFFPGWGFLGILAGK